MVRMMLSDGGVRTVLSASTPLGALVDASPVSVLQEGSMISEPRVYGFDDSYYGYDGQYYGYWEDVAVF